MNPLNKQCAQAILISFLVVIAFAGVAEAYDPSPAPLSFRLPPHLTFPTFFVKPLDYEKLSRAVSVAETSGCKDGTALKRNNCHGIMCWPHGQRTPCYFKSQAESHAAFKKIWAKSYKRFPDVALAKKYTGNDHPDEWLAIVKKVYNSL